MGLLHIHDEYERLREQLQYLAQSPRNQVLLIQEFLNSVFHEKHPEFLRTYIAEMVSHLLEILPDISPIGTSPHFLVTLRETLSQGFALTPSFFSDQDIASAMDTVHLMHMKALLYVGEMEDLRYRKAWARLTNEGSNEREPLERLTRLIEMVESHHDPIADLRAIEGQWHEDIRVSETSACLPVVEQNISLGAIRSFHPFGRIVCLSAMAGAPSPKEDRGRLTISTLHQGIETMEIRSELDRIANAANEMASRIIRHPARDRRTVLASFSDSTLPYLGSSFNLALAIEYLCLQSRHSLDAESMSLRGGTIITGPLDADGSISPLPDDIIATKVETVFHSPFSRLVLPKANEATALRCLADLRTRHPNRNVKLVAVSDLDDVFNHREVIAIRRVPWARRLHNGLRRHARVITLGSVLGMLAIGLLALIFLVDFDTSPDRVLIQGNTFHILNRNNRTLWTAPISQSLVRFELDNGSPFESRGLTAIADVDGDGSSEVLLGHPRTEPGFSDSLYCMNADGSRKWSAFLGQPSITGEGDFLHSGFHMLYVLADNLDQDPELEIICTATNDFHTNMVYVFDHTGRKLSSYYHPGSLFNTLIIQNPVTQEKEILFGGTNNGLRKAVLVVMDPEFMNGACQAGPSRGLHYPVMPESSEKYYLVFPDTDLYERSSGYPFTWVTPFVFETAGLTIQKSEGIEFTPSTAMSENRTAVFYVCDSMYRIREFRTSSNFDHEHRMLKKLGVITSTLDSLYAVTMMRGVRYWNGDSLVVTPCMTKNFQRKRRSIPNPPAAVPLTHKEEVRHRP